MFDQMIIRHKLIAYIYVIMFSFVPAAYAIPPKTAWQILLKQALNQALLVFKKSPTLRKKQLIQIMVPKLVVDEKNDGCIRFRCTY
jgi:hypothetical protein